MNYLLDTNVVSELARRDADRRLLAWAGSLAEEQVYLSVVTIAEIRKGIALLPQGKRRSSLDEWLREGLLDRFRQRIVGVGVEIAELWGLLAAQARSKGAGFPAMDGFLAATALKHQFAIATRNTKDFSQLNVKVINPWLHEPEQGNDL
ncbi:MAG: type II toxin-antitoxin system VapC family toxin [Beijerinckiaceae bacterium]